MADAALIMSVTFAMGYIASLIRLPPLIGFLSAGFVLNAFGHEEVPIIDTIGGLGVTLLLFGIGLKLDLRSLLGREVWLTSSVHMLASVVAGAAFLWAVSLTGLALLTNVSLGKLALLGLALAFSSTVFVVKMLEERGEADAFYGRIAIGILIMQDIVAVAFLTATSGHLPSIWAISVILLWPASKVIRKLWTRIGHGEMQALFGIVMALVPGYLFFSIVGLKGDLGALIMSILLASHKNSSELARSLFHFKELLLIGFFVSIGLAGGLPNVADVLIAGLLLLLLPVRAAGYAFLLRLAKVRQRTAWLTAFGLMQYSEFGLIVVAVGVDAGLIDAEWLIVVSVAVAFSFIISAIVNAKARTLIEHLAARAPEQDPMSLHPEDRPADITGAEALIVGMGRIGQSAYQRFDEDHEIVPVGVDSDGARAKQLTARGMRTVEADASDAEFWQRLIGRDQVRVVILAMPRHGANLSVVKSLRAAGFTGTISAVARFDDEAEQTKKYGADASFNVYGAAGMELADDVMRREHS